MPPRPSYLRVSPEEEEADAAVPAVELLHLVVEVHYVGSVGHTVNWE